MGDSETRAGRDRALHRVLIPQREPLMVERAGDAPLVARDLEAAPAAVQGVGPARIETFELSWNGQPMSSTKALLVACCAAAPQTTAVIFQGLAAPRILRAGDHVDFVAIADSQEGDLFSKFNVERDKITVQVCYCSVFDECWLGSGITSHAGRVASCPTPAVPFQIQ